MQSSPILSESARWELYRVLGEPVRLQLLALSAEEELTIGELATLVGESQPNVSRHTQALRQAGLVSVRKQGTRALVRITQGVLADAVVRDAVESGRTLSATDGSLGRIEEVLRLRDQATREYFEHPRGEEPAGGLPGELGAYLHAFSFLLPHRGLAIDMGTGDGGLLDVLAPTFERVVAIDRSKGQLERAEQRAHARGYRNITFVRAEAFDDEVQKTYAGKADVVFAVRLLHHAPRPAALVASLGRLLRPNGVGAALFIDYAHHEDESMREQADVWLGFEPSELKAFAREAGLAQVHVAPLPSPARGEGAHLPWQVMLSRSAQHG